MQPDDKPTPIERKWGQSLAAHRGGPCLEAEQLTALASGRRPTGSEAWLDHISACPSCRAAYKGLLDLEAERPSWIASWLRLPPAPVWRGAAVAAVAVCAAVIGYRSFQMSQTPIPPATGAQPGAVSPLGPAQPQVQPEGSAARPAEGSRRTAIVPSMPAGSSADAMRVRERGKPSFPEVASGKAGRRQRGTAPHGERRPSQLAGTRPVMVASTYGLAFRNGSVYEHGALVPGLSRGDAERAAADLSGSHALALFADRIAEPSNAPARRRDLGNGLTLGAPFRSLKPDDVHRSGAKDGTAEEGALTGPTKGVGATGAPLGGPRAGAAGRAGGSVGGGMGGGVGGGAFGGGYGGFGAPAGGTTNERAAPDRAAGGRVRGAPGAPPAGPAGSEPSKGVARGNLGGGRPKDDSMAKAAPRGALRDDLAAATTADKRARLALVAPDPGNYGLMEKQPSFEFRGNTNVNGYQLGLQAADDKEAAHAAVQLRVTVQPTAGTVVARPVRPLAEDKDYYLTVTPRAETMNYQFNRAAAVSEMESLRAKTHLFRVLDARTSAKAKWALAHRTDAPIASGLILYDAGMYADALESLKLAPKGPPYDAWRARLEKQVAQRREGTPVASPPTRP